MTGTSCDGREEKAGGRLKIREGTGVTEGRCGSREREGKGVQKLNLEVRTSKKHQNTTQDGN